MAEAASTGMEKAEMRKLLVATKEHPVNCAIGVGKDQTVGLLTLDKMKGPRILEKQLMLALPDAKNTRFGTAQVDWENDPKLVKLFLNKPISGMAKRLVKTLKGTGFSKVQIMMEDGTPVEGAADDEEAAAANGAAPAEPAAAEAEPAAAPPPPPPPPEAKAAAPDAGELTRRLAALAPRIPQAAGDNAERKAELLKLASLGNVNIKTNNLTYAATYIEQLARALDAAPPAPPPPPTAAAAPAKDAAALSKELAALIPRVAQVGDPAQKAVLAKLATDANVNIKTNNLTYAATYIAQLRNGLDGGTTGAAASDAADYDAQSKAWTNARAAVEADLGKLRAAILDAYKGQPFAGEIAAKYEARTAPVLGTLDLRLAETLGAAAKAPDASKRTELLTEAKGMLAGYRAYAADALLADLDANPFVPLSVKATVLAALDGVSKALP